jgi:hypothetical protein
MFMVTNRLSILLGNFTHIALVIMILLKKSLSLLALGFIALRVLV